MRRRGMVAQVSGETYTAGTSKPKRKVKTVMAKAAKKAAKKPAAKKKAVAKKAGAKKK